MRHTGRLYYYLYRTFTFLVMFFNTGSIVAEIFKGIIIEAPWCRLIHKGIKKAV